MRNKTIFKEINKPPSGLTVCQLDCDDVLHKALPEIEAIFRNDCKDQIALHKHFFISQPFPLHGDREALTPVLQLNSLKIFNVLKLLHATLKTFNVNVNILRSTNIIVREYNIGEGIPFHIDHMDCKQDVFGIILLNNNQNNNGISFTKGDGKYTLHYRLKEQIGTVFRMRGVARYKWKHGVIAVNDRRISITLRTYKDAVLKQYQLLYRDC